MRRLLVAVAFSSGRFVISIKLLECWKEFEQHLRIDHILLCLQEVLE